MKRKLLLLLMLFTAASQALPRIIMRPVTWISAEAPSEFWGMLDAPRDACEGAQYQWSFQCGDGTLITSTGNLEGNVHDGWSIPCALALKMADGGETSEITATLTVTMEDESVTASQTYPVQPRFSGDSPEEIEKWRQEIGRAHV